MEKCLKLKILQLHGTGLHYKTHLGGRHGVLRQFPDIEEQIQIKVKIFTFVESNIFLQQTKQTSHNQFPVQPLSISLFQLHLKSFPTSDFDILHFSGHFNKQGESDVHQETLLRVYPLSGGA